MSISQSILTMSFCMLVVFIVLTALWGIIRLFTYVVQLFEKQSINADNSSTK